MKSLDSELIRPKRVRKLVSVSKVPKSFSSPVNLNVSFSGRQLTQIRNLQIAEFGYGPHRKSPLFFSFFYFFFQIIFFGEQEKKSETQVDKRRNKMQIERQMEDFSAFKETNKNKNGQTHIHAPSNLSN